jgi:hypothetical protein
MLCGTVLTTSVYSEITEDILYAQNPSTLDSDTAEISVFCNYRSNEETEECCLPGYKGV